MANFSETLFPHGPAVSLTRSRMEVKPFSKVTVFALASSLGFTALSLVALILLATTLSEEHLNIHSLVVTAATLQSIGAGLLVRMTWRERNRKGMFRASDNSVQPRRKLDAIVAFITLLVGHTATLASIIWIMVDKADVESATDGSPPLVVYTLAGFWTLAIASEATFSRAFYSDVIALEALRQSRRLQSSMAYWPIENQRSRSESLESTNDPNFFLNTTSASSSQKRLQFSLPGAHFTTSGRRPQRRGSSEPLNRPPSTPTEPSIGGTHSSRESNSSAFDCWDTSAVSGELRRAMGAEHPEVATHGSEIQARLPTIPGSRPVSLANILETPFLLLDDDNDDGQLIEQDITLLPPPRALLEPLDGEDDNPFFKPLPTLPIRQAPAASTSSLRISRPQMAHYHTYDSSTNPLNSRNSLKRSSAATHRPNLLRAVSLASIDGLSQTRSSATTPTQERHDRHPASHSRDPSRDGNESHIHPLFRTTSPSPPPLTSINTVVTAAPVQLVDIPISMARNMSAASSIRSGVSPPMSPRLPRSPASLVFSNHLNNGPASASPRSQHFPTASQASVGERRSGSGSSSRSHSRSQSRQGAGQRSRAGSRPQSRAGSRPGSRSGGVFQRSAGDVPPTPTSPIYPTSPASVAFPVSQRSPASPVVAVSPSGKVITRDDLARTGNFIVCE